VEIFSLQNQLQLIIAVRYPHHVIKKRALSEKRYLLMILTEENIFHFLRDFLA